MSVPEFTDTDMDELNYRLNNPTHTAPLDDEPFDHLLTFAANAGLIGCIALAVFVIGVQVGFAVNP